MFDNDCWSPRQQSVFFIEILRLSNFFNPNSHHSYILYIKTTTGCFTESYEILHLTQNTTCAFHMILSHAIQFRRCIALVWKIFQNRIFRFTGIIDQHTCDKNISVGRYLWDITNVMILKRKMLIWSTRAYCGQYFYLHQAGKLFSKPLCIWCLNHFRDPTPHDGNIWTDVAK